jgi:hypothetical protein
VSGEAGQHGQQPPGAEVAAEAQERSRELQRIFGELLAAAQKLSYELATLDHKQTYTSEELKDLLAAAREVVMATKKFHRFLERYARP